MLGRDPALVVLSTTGDSGPVRTNNGNLIGRVNVLRATGRLLSALATLAAALLLGKEGGDPGAVDEVDGPGEGAQENEVEEDARARSATASETASGGMEATLRAGRNIHLRVKNAGGSLNNADSLVVDGDGVEGFLRVLEHSYQLETHILGVHLGAEAVRDGLLLAGRNVERVALGGEILQDARFIAGVLEQRAADDGDADGLGLFIGDGQARLGGVAIDELHAEDLGLRKAGRHGDLEVGRLGLLDDLFDVFDLGATVNQIMSPSRIAEPHLDLGEGIEGPQREEEQGRELPGDHG